MFCNIITEGLIGTENQCIAVSNALNIETNIMRISLNQPWKSLSPWLGLENSRAFDPEITSPWPDLLITSGRKSIAAARYVKKQSGDKTLSLHIQNPKVALNQFDLVAAPYHDNIQGENVIVTDAAPTKISHALLEKEKSKYTSLFEKLPSPLVAVLIGGNSKTHTLNKQKIDELIEQLRSLDAGLMITASRRTGEDNIIALKSALADLENVFFYDGSGDNPYIGMLAYADYIIATNDSVSMISDAGSTGKPVHIIELEGSSPKFDRFYDHMNKLNIIKPFDGDLLSWRYEPLNDAEKIAKIVRERLKII
ncbi:MAG: mitochondrial fission ELM1 family protein [Pseudomonadota bacterium]